MENSVAETVGSKWTIIPFDPQAHDRSGFDCGVAILNGWLATKVSQFEKKDLARTYVLVESGHKTFSGFYAQSNHAMVYESLPTGQARGLPGTSSDVAIP